MCGDLCGDMEKGCQGNKKPAQQAMKCCFGQGYKCGAIEWLDQIQFGCPFDSRPAIIDVEFTVDALGMCTHRTQSDHELTGDFGSLKIGFE